LRLAAEAFIFTQPRGNEVSLTSKMLAAVSDGWTADILKEVEGLSAWIRLGVAGDGTSVRWWEVQHEYSFC
jgi:hypothetical protein